MNTQSLVKTALKEKNPALYRDLKNRGELAMFLTETADQINDQIVTLTMEIAGRMKSRLPPAKSLMEAAGILKQAESAATEIVLKEMLEFPQDDPP